MNDLVIIGAGGVGRATRQIIADINRRAQIWNLIGFLDGDKVRQGTRLHGLPVLGDIDWLEQHPQTAVVIAVGKPAIRYQLARALGPVHLATVIHPLAWVADSAHIGAGTIVYPGACVDPDVRIGQHVILNSGCTLGHDTVIGDYATISPGVNVGGAVHIGPGCELGIHSAALPGVSIGAWSVLGGGAVLVKDLDPNTTVVGVPAKIIARRPPRWYEEGT